MNPSSNSSSTESLHAEAPAEAPDTEPLPSEFAHTGRFKWSASRLKRLLQCPRQFRYVYIEGLPTATTAPLAFGRVIHEVVCAAHEAQMTDGGLPSPEALLARFDAGWEEILARQEILFRASHPAPERYVKQGHETLRVFHALNQKAAPPLAVELAFEVEIGPHLVRGVIDRVDEVTGSEGERALVIVDYKSGTRRPTQTEAHSDVQLTLYAQALEKWLALPVVGVEFHALRDGTQIASTRGPNQFHWLRDALSYGERVRAEGAYPPCPGYWCRWCDYQSQCQAEGLPLAKGGQRDGLRR